MAYLSGKTLIVIKKEKNYFIGRVAKDGNKNLFIWPKQWRGLYGNDLKKIIGNGAICCDKMGLELISSDLESIQNALQIAKKMK